MVRHSIIWMLSDLNRVRARTTFRAFTVVFIPCVIVFDTGEPKNWSHDQHHARKHFVDARKRREVGRDRRQSQQHGRPGSLALSIAFTHLCANLKSRHGSHRMLTCALNHGGVWQPLHNHLLIFSLLPFHFFKQADKFRSSSKSLREKMWWQMCKVRFNACQFRSLL